MPEPRVKNKLRSRNKNGTWRKKRSDSNKSNLKDVLEKTVIRVISLKEWNDKNDEVEALKRQIDVLVKDNAELRIKLKAWERETEVKKNGG